MMLSMLRFGAFVEGIDATRADEPDDDDAQRQELASLASRIGAMLGRLLELCTVEVKGKRFFKPEP